MSEPQFENSMWQAVKAFAPLLSALLNGVIILAIYIWSNKNIEDKKVQNRVEHIPDDLKNTKKELKAEIKEWLELRDTYYRECVKAHSEDIAELYKKTSLTEQTAVRNCDKLENMERRCDERFSSVLKV